MQILVELDGVLRDKDESIIPIGVIMYGTLTVYNRMTIISSMTEADTKRWLDINKVVDYDLIIDNSVYLVGENPQERQINFARSQGGIDLFITGNPKLWAYAFNLGIPSVMFGVPSYTRVEFRPDAPKKVRAWTDIEEAIEKQNQMRTQDARLTRTEALNFE
jgi:hypothetical protein